MKDEYVSKIVELLHQCENLSTLDLVLNLLEQGQ